CRAVSPTQLNSGGSSDWCEMGRCGSCVALTRLGSDPVLARGRKGRESAVSLPAGRTDALAAAGTDALAAPRPHVPAAPGADVLPAPGTDVLAPPGANAPAPPSANAPAPASLGATTYSAIPSAAGHKHASNVPFRGAILPSAFAFGAAENSSVCLARVAATY